VSRRWQLALEVAVVVGVVAVAFAVRVLGEWHHVFNENGVWYLGADGWYHIRLAEYILQHPGDFLRFDPLAAYPDGLAVGFRPMVGWIAVLFTEFATFGKPTVEALREVAAFVPPVVGAATLVPVYLLVRQLHPSRIVAVGTILLVALLPTEFFHRSSLGFTDQHVVEVLWTVLAVLFLVVGVKQRRWHYGILAGAMQMLLFMTWHGATFLTSILCLWVILDGLVGHFAGRDITPTVKLFGAFIGTAALMSVPFLRYVGAPPLQYVTLGSATLLVPLLWAIGCWFPRGRKGAALLVALSASGGLTLWLLDQNVATVSLTAARAWQELQSIFYGADSSILEAQATTFRTMWFCYGMAGFLALGGLYLSIRRQLPLPFLVWAIVILIAGIAQRRWGYYATIPVAFMAVSSIWWAVAVYPVGLWQVAKAVARFTATGAARFGRISTAPIPPDVRRVLVVMVVLAVAGTTLPGMIATARIPPSLTTDVYHACLWMKNNTPEPLEDGAPTYGVLSWWDYGHWIISVGERAPVSSPTWQDAPSQWFFAVDNVQDAEALLGDLNIRYIMVTQSMVGGKFYAIVHKMRHGNYEGWEEMLYRSMAWKLYHSWGFGPYELVFAAPTVRIFERH